MRLLLALSVCLSCSLAGTGEAQTLPVPRLPLESGPESAEPAGGSLPVGGGASTSNPIATADEQRPWEYGLSVGVVRSRNIDLLVPDDTAHTGILPRLDLARILSGPRGQLRISADASWVGYRSEFVRDRFYGSGAMRGGYQVSSTATVEGFFEYGMGYSDTAATLIAQGVPLPLVETRSLRGELGIRQRLGSLTSLLGSGRVYSTSFDGPGLVDGKSLRLTMGAERAVAARASLALVYSAEVIRSDSQPDPYLTHFGSLQWSHLLSERTGLLLEAGASYTPDASRADLQNGESFYGGLTVARRLGRSRVTAYIRREVAPAFGLGVSRLETRVGVRADVPAGRRWSLRGGGDYVHPAVPEDAGFASASSADIVGGVTRRIGRLSALSAEVRYRRRGDIARAGPVSAIEAGIFWSFGPISRWAGWAGLGG
jgi:hypothetical protein